MSSGTCTTSRCGRPAVGLVSAPEVRAAEPGGAGDGVGRGGGAGGRGGALRPVRRPAASLRLDRRRRPGRSPPWRAISARTIKAGPAESNRLLAIRNFDRGQAAFEKGEIGPGMLWMIESWRSAVDAGDPAWQHVARANLAAWRPHYPRLKAVLSHTMPVMAAAFSPDSRTVISGSMDGTAQLWDVASGKTYRSVTARGRPVASRRVQSGWQDRVDRLRGTTRHGSGMRPQANRSASLCACRLKSISWPLQSSPRGRSCWWGSEVNADNIVRLWDAATGQPIGPPLTHHRTCLSSRVQSRRPDHPHPE